MDTKKNTKVDIKEYNHLKEPKDKARFIQEQESDFYGGKDEDGNTVRISLQQGSGMDIHTNQSNGWTRVDEYDTDGFNVGSGFDGRWDREEGER